MADSTYDVDDILEELRKRKEQKINDFKLASKDAAEDMDIKTAEEDAEAEAQAKEEIEKIISKTHAEPEFKMAEHEISEHKNEMAEPEILEEKQEIALKAPEAEEEKTNEPIEEKAEPEQDENGEVNLFELAGYETTCQEENPKNRKNGQKNRKNGEKEKFRNTKKGKIVISVISILLALIIGAGIFAAVYINKMLNEVTEPDDNQQTDSIEDWSGMDELKEDFSPILEAPKSEISNLSDMCKTWYYTGKPASSSRVLNILLIGEDTRGDEIVDEGFRADSAIVASVNQDTGKIILTSILRDTYVYYEVEEGNKESGKFSKINEAMSYGGLDCYIRAVENNYKINIDNYVLVNFESFKTIIDTLGGVDIEVTSAEIKEINNHQSRYGNVTIKKSFEGKSGLVHLNGEQALAYCRIRYIDSDGERANRQKRVLSTLFEKAQSSSTLKSVEVVTKLLPYVKTGAKKQEVINLATYALKNNWISFKLEKYNVPENYLDENGAEVVLAIGGSYKGSWKWRGDLPLAAKVMQERIYGKTSITLNENRPKFANLA